MRASRTSLVDRLRLTPPWIVIGLAALAVRLALILLPGIGRDEAAYDYWAGSGEPAYAPLFLLLIRVYETLLPAGLLAVRMTSIVGGIVVLGLVDLHLRLRGVSRAGRYLAAATVAFTPWQTYVGAILHPDTIFLAALLVFVISASRHYLIFAAVAIGCAVLAKPTGIVLLGVLAWLIWSDRETKPAKRALAILVGFGLAAPAVLLWSEPDMVLEIMSFGRMSAEIPAWPRLGLGLASLLCLGGPLLLAAGWQGVRDRWTIAFRRRPADLEGRLVLITSFTLFATLAAAAVINGQFKANWYLPAVVLLWPTRPLRVPRAIIGSTLALSILASGVLALCLSRPDLVERVETRFPHRDGLHPDGLYPVLAGMREARVSASRSWSDRVREYRGMSAFAGEVATLWRDTSGRAGYPDWIVADDYGLAAQLAYEWRDAAPDLAIPADGLYRRRARSAVMDRPAGKLILGVQTPLQQVWPRLGPVAEAGIAANPATGGEVYVGVPCNQTPRRPVPGCPGGE